MNPEEQYEIFSDFFSEPAVESMFNNLPQETLDELLQVVKIIDRRVKMYRNRIKELEQQEGVEA